jgi:purine-binding chemotaxis protein CheW
MSEQHTRQLVVFSLAAQPYALSIRSVREILHWTEPRRIPSTDPSVRGIISLRGKIVPVLDLATRLGLPAEHPEDANILIIEHDGKTSGIVVDDVEDVITVAEDQLDRGGAAVSGACIEAIAEVEDRLIVVLHHDRVTAVDTGSLREEEAPAADGTALATVAAEAVRAA